MNRIVYLWEQLLAPLKTNTLTGRMNYLIPDELKKRRRGCRGGVKRRLQRSKHRSIPVHITNPGSPFPLRQHTINPGRGRIQENLRPVPCIALPRLLLQHNCSRTPACCQIRKQSKHPSCSWNTGLGSCWKVVYTEHVGLHPSHTTPTVALFLRHQNTRTVGPNSSTNTARPSNTGKLTSMCSSPY